MTQRLGRRSAGERVVARAQRLSDDLLLLEEDCFAEVNRLFTLSAGPAVAAVDAGWVRAKDDVAALANDARLRDTLADLHRGVLEATRAPVAALSGQVASLAAEAIGDELETCEETLAKRYVGITATALVRVATRSETLVTDRLTSYEAALPRGQAAFVDLLLQQMLLARQYGDDPTRVWKRLFSPEPNSLPGNGGRGIWWRATSGLHGAAQEVSIRLASTIRLAAMEEFNAAGATR